MDLPTGTHAVRLEFHAVALTVSGMVAAIVGIAMFVMLAHPGLRYQLPVICSPKRRRSGNT